MTVADRASALVLLICVAFCAYQWDRGRLEQVARAREAGRDEGLNDAWRACEYVPSYCDNSVCEFQRKENYEAVVGLYEWHLERRLLDLRECIHLGGCTENQWSDDMDDWQRAYVQQRQMHRARWEPGIPGATTWGHWDAPGRGDVEIFDDHPGHGAVEFDGRSFPPGSP
jgi:hypothetical protein